jgi:hypothetical protein
MREDAILAKKRALIINKALDSVDNKGRNLQNLLEANNRA